MDITHYRLSNQLIVNRKVVGPVDVVARLGAVQAQDYPGALWAIGLRIPKSNVKLVEQAISDRKIIRTWPMRGTLHFIKADDVHWMLTLLTPRIISGSKGRLKQLEIDENTISRCKKLIIKTLQGEKSFTREAIYKMLESSGISTKGQRGIHILWLLAQDGLICFGAREGKQQTFVLLDEWVHQTKTYIHDEALAELAKRYFISHGPATLRDYIWWSGLPASDARTGLEMIKKDLIHEIINDQTYWLSKDNPDLNKIQHNAFLLPAFDEYLVGYKDRNAVYSSQVIQKINQGVNLLSPVIVENGKVIGKWKRILGKNKIAIEPKFIDTSGKPLNHDLNVALQKYGEFLNMPVFQK